MIQSVEPLHVDFNDLDDDEHLHVVVDTEIAPGSIRWLLDSDGNSARGTVLAVQRGVGVVAVDWATWRSGADDGQVQGQANAVTQQLGQPIVVHMSGRYRMAAAGVDPAWKSSVGPVPIGDGAFANAS
jgi:hypothetical protein